MCIEKESIHYGKEFYASFYYKNRIRFIVSNALVIVTTLLTIVYA